jgi:hypothetical protein
MELAWREDPKPSVQQLAARIVRGMHAHGFGSVHHRDGEVDFTDAPWDLGNWHPFTYVSRGTISISSSPKGFRLRYSISLVRVLALLVVAGIGGLLISTLIPNMSARRWLPFLWLAGTGLLTSLLIVFWSFPRALVRMTGEQVDAAR